MPPTLYFRSPCAASNKAALALTLQPAPRLQAIDADRCLDEDWSREAGQDAEDKYFSGE